MPKIKTIQEALIAMVRPGMTSKQLHDEIAKQFPKASKKEIRLAAFGAMIAIVDKSPEEAIQLQDYALGDESQVVGAR